MCVAVVGIPFLQVGEDVNGLGENRTVNNLQAGKVTRDFETVGEWFSSLDDAGKAKIMRFLESESQQEEATRRFFADPYKNKL